MQNDLKEHLIPKNSIEQPVKKQPSSLLKNPYFFRALAAGSVALPLEIAFLFDFIPNPIPTSLAKIIGGTSFIIMNYSGWNYFRKFFQSLIHFPKNPFFTMDMLVTLSCYSAWIYAMLVAFVDELKNERGHLICFTVDALFTLTALNISNSIRSHINKKINSHHDTILKKLEQRQPQEVEKLDGAEIPLREIAINEIIVVQPNCYVPVDGILQQESAIIDEMTLRNGDQGNIIKSAGETIYAGTLNKHNMITLKTICHGGESKFNIQINSLKKNNELSNFRLNNIIEKITQYFVPTILIAAGGSLLAWYNLSGDLHKGIHSLINVLFSACPCTLSLAIPLAVNIAQHTAFKHGIAICKDDAIPAASSINTIIFDKTGTLTSPQVSYVHPENNRNEILAIAAQLEKKSSHPLARAIKQAATSDHIEIETAHEICLINQGITGKIGENSFIIGSEFALNTQGIQCNADQANESVFLAKNQKIIGRIDFEHTLRPAAEETISKLKAGYEIILLSGSHQKSVEKIAKQLNIDNYYAHQDQDDKKQFIENRKNQNRTMMVGDGLNDITAAQSCAISVAIEPHTYLSAAANVILSGQLTDLLLFMDIARTTFRNIKQNITWGIFYNVCMVMLSSIIFPLFEIESSHGVIGASMAFASLLVVFNASRLISLINSLAKKYYPENTAKSSSTSIFPSPQLENRNSIDSEMTFIINGPHCESCARKIRRLLEGPQITQLSVLQPVNEQCEIRVTSDLSRDEVKTFIKEKLADLFSLDEESSAYDKLHP